MQNPPMVFLSYAAEDRQEVTSLYDHLQAAGYRPWMDSKDIVAGEVWDHCIRRAIRQSDFFIACLSRTSVNKRGYVQKEIRMALNILEEKLGQDIYLIPVRLGPCEVQEDLSEHQRVDLFEQDGFDGLIESLKLGVARFGETGGERATSWLHLVERPHSLECHVQEYDRTIVQVHVEYPQIDGLRNQLLQTKVNHELTSQALTMFRQIPCTPGHKDIQEIDPNGLDPTKVRSWSITYRVSYLDDNYVSVEYRESITGARVPGFTSTRNYFLPSVQLLEINDLFDPATGYLETLSEICIQDILNQTIDRLSIESSDYDMRHIREGAGPSEQNLQNISLFNDALCIHFRSYSVGPGCLGKLSVEIPYVSIAHLAHSNGPIPYLIRQSQERGTS